MLSSHAPQRRRPLQPSRCRFDVATALSALKHDESESLVAPPCIGCGSLYCCCCSLLADKFTEVVVGRGWVTIGPSERCVALVGRFVLFFTSSLGIHLFFKPTRPALEPFDLRNLILLFLVSCVTPPHPTYHSTTSHHRPHQSDVYNPAFATMQQPPTVQRPTATTSPTHSTRSPHI